MDLHPPLEADSYWTWGFPCRAHGQASEPRIRLSLSPKFWCYRGKPPLPALKWELRMQTQVLRIPQKALRPVGSLPRPILLYIQLRNQQLLGLKELWVVLITGWQKPPLLCLPSTIVFSLNPRRVASSLGSMRRLWVLNTAPWLTRYCVAMHSSHWTLKAPEHLKGSQSADRCAGNKIRHLEDGGKMGWCKIPQ